EARDGRVEPEVLTPQRQHGLPRAPDRADEQNREAEGGEDLPVLAEDRPRGPGRPPWSGSGRGPAALPGRGTDGGDDGGRGERGPQREPVAGADVAAVDDGGAGEGPDEQADAVDAGERGKYPGAPQRRGDLGEVGVPGEVEHRRRGADEEHAGGEDREVRGEGTTDEADRGADPREEHGVAVTEPGGERTGRHVGEELPDRDEGGHRA